MLKLSLREIIEELIPQKIINPKKLDLSKVFIDKVFTDSRKIDVGKGGIFICLKGENFDAHDFINEVISKGVEGIIIENEDKIPYSRVSDIIFLKVDNSLLALGKLAKLVINRKRERNKDFRVIAIAGSAGKTTTKNILKNIFEFANFKVVASEKNFNNEIGVPLTVFQINEDTSFLILEMGMRGFGQIDYLCSITNPDYGILTSIGPEHLEFVKNIKGVIKAETELTNFIYQKGGYFLVPTKIKKIYQNYQNFDCFPNKNYHLKNYKIFRNDEFSTHADIVFKNKVFKVNIKSIISKSIILNFLISLMMFDKVMGDGDVIDYMIKNFQKIIEVSLEKDRFYFEKLNKDIFVISDFYNSNYLSLKENLKVIEKIASFFRNVVLFIGDMLELGKYSDFYHSIVVKKMVNSGMQVYFIGENFFKFRGYGNGLVKFFKSVDDIQENVIGNINKGSLIFIKGSRGIRLEKVYQKIRTIFKEEGVFE